MFARSYERKIGKEKKTEVGAKRHLLNLFDMD